MNNRLGFGSSGTPNATPFPGGQLIIGQSQNGSGESLRADIMHFNMWQRFLSEPEIVALHSDCSVKFASLGTLVPWPEIQVRLRGDVKRVEFLRCQVEGKTVTAKTDVVFPRNFAKRVNINSHDM